MTNLHRIAHRPLRASRSGFTLIEAVVATGLAAIAASALLLGVTQSLDATHDALDQALAAGIAQQMMDEILGTRYDAYGVGGQQVGLGPNSWEQQGAGRSRFDDIDDFHGLRVQPPQDPYGVPLGLDDGAGGQRHPNFQIRMERLARWRVQVAVYYVDGNDFSAPLRSGRTSEYRAVEVRVLDGAALLAQLRRVVAYLPPA